LLTAAKAAGENELDVSWSSDVMGGSDGAKKFEALFNSMYGTNIAIRHTPGPSMTDMTGKVVQEALAGHPASTDVLVGSETHFGPLVDKDVLQHYDYTQLSPRITPDIVLPGNIGVEITSRFPGIMYNPQKIAKDRVPKTLEDALAPEFKGKIAANVDGAGLSRLAYHPSWTTQKLLDYTTKLSANIAGLIRCGETQRLASGEFDMMVMDCGTYAARKAKAQGQQIESVIPDDAATVAFFNLGVPATSTHPNLAKLYINMLVSEEGQRLEYDLEYTDLYSLPGSRSMEDFKPLQARGMPLLKMDINFFLQHSDSSKIADQVTQILRTKQ
jgi:iron(III) transport system substrate-binding protein